MYFHAEPWHELDTAGNLVGTTVVWFREREQVSEAYEYLVLAMLSGFFTLLYCVLSDTPQMSELVFLAMLVPVLLGIGYLGYRLCTARRELTFHDNGSLAVPRHWLTNWLWGPRVLADHREVAVIQIQEQEYPDGKPQTPPPNMRRRYEVWFYFANGYSMCIINGLFRGDAHHVAVLLEQALAEIRTAASNYALGDNTQWADVIVD